MVRMGKEYIYTHGRSQLFMESELLSVINCEGLFVYLRNFFEFMTSSLYEI
jgi:hypothetical protein